MNSSSLLLGEKVPQVWGPPKSGIAELQDKLQNSPSP